jgi:hypothetical protein
VAGDGAPERVSLGPDQSPDGNKAEAVILAVGVDPLDALAQGVDGLAHRGN